MTSEASERKPCPFCWSDVLEVVPQPAFEDDENPPQVVTCISCGADGPPAKDAEQAVEFWNRRDDGLWLRPDEVTR
jgi:Lar family restriction alleviation protein